MAYLCVTTSTVLLARLLPRTVAETSKLLYIVENPSKAPAATTKMSSTLREASLWLHPATPNNLVPPFLMCGAKYFPKDKVAVPTLVAEIKINNTL